MRISGGIARGIPLSVPKTRDVRPATDRLRQAVFSSIAGWLPGVRFLDLFAGSGAYGLEALSRGAVSGVFVELDSKTIPHLEQNIKAVCKSMGSDPDILTVIEADATDVPMGNSEAPDLVFIDPPYDMIIGAAEPMFEKLSTALAKKADAIVIFEMPGDYILNPPGWEQIKRLGQGVRQPTAVFFRKKM
jgi:16S rRNA (guanine966-N2)-methyltransferase